MNIGKIDYFRDKITQSKFMQAFLFRIAALFYQKYGDKISEFTFVFPNRRAGLFFQKHLSSLITKAVFSPEVITVNDCFASVSSKQVVDRLSLLFRLYTIYKDLSKSDESFDTFAYWGEMLLADFDEVDKYRVNAKQLFTNITELKQIDRIFDVFTPKQKEVIKQFWKNFIPVKEGNTEEEFIATWKILYPVYVRLREELAAENLATEGMIFREVSDSLNKNGIFEQWQDKQFVFVGFNALNPSEKILFSSLQKAGQADFYWDYESPILRETENQASLFFNENTKIFPPKFEITPSVVPFEEKNIELIAVPSEVGQTKQLYEILKQIASKTTENDWINTAIVLPDENLLIPILHALPENVDKVNVTMGFPLKTTPVAGLIEHIFELHKRQRAANNGSSYYYQNVLNILNHQYVGFACGKITGELTKKITENNRIYVDADDLAVHPLLKSIFKGNFEIKSFVAYLLKILDTLQSYWRKEKSNKTHQIELDYIYQYYIVLNRLADILKKMPEQIEMSLDTMIRFIKQMITGISIPFTGEPLEGLQIMGVLETRGIDFENLIITSFNEGVFPKRTVSNSFIPYNLRKAFDLSTHEHQDAVSAYNFYRLINRAKNLYFLYDSRTEGIQTGEVSRYMHQLYYHYGVKYTSKTVAFDIAFDNPPVLKVEKSPEIQTKLSAFLSSQNEAPALSASSINDYINCPLKFYLTRIENIEQTEEIKESIEDNVFGTLFHAVMEALYKPYKTKIIQADDIESMIKNQLLIDTEITRAFSKHYFKKQGDVLVKLEGNYLLTARVIKKYVRQLLKIDKEYAPFCYIGAEEKCKIQFPIHDGKSLVNIKGYIDRIDEKEGKIRIIDYKTGKGKLDFKNLHGVFERNNDSRETYVLQTMLYGLLYKNKAENKVIVPGIYYIRDIYKTPFETQLLCKEGEKGVKQTVDDFSVFEKEFSDLLKNCLEEIFNPDVPFVQSESSKPCKYCAYIGVCKR